jgi:TonB-linked SusC/RagA family outer membrane protein
MHFKKKIILSFFLFLLVLISYAQTNETKSISGVIFDKTGELIIGASIKLDGANIGTISDINGKFSLNVPENGKLVISYVGYITQIVSVAGKTTFNIVLEEDSKTLDELVVIGYGLVKKSDLTGSVSKLTSDNAEEKAYSSIEQMMQGRVSGVQITQNTGGLGGGMSFNIRGANSITGSNQPLVVIDGYPVESGIIEINTGSEANFSGDVPSINALASLNPNDIASIEILKDASSTAIYGSRGANGVVMITTKRGKEGKDKIQYSLRTDLSHLPKKIDMLNSMEYMAYSNEAYMDKRDGSVAYDAAAILKNGAYNTNWQDLIYRTGYSQNHQLNLSGGDKKMKYALALGYLSQEGIVKNTSFDRGTIRLNLDREINARLKFSVNVDGSMSMNKAVNQAAKSSDVGASIVSASLRTPPIYAAYNDTESDIAITTGITNPLILITKADDRYRLTQVKVSANADYRFTRSFYFRVRAGLNTTNGLRQYYMPRGTYLGDTRLGYAYEGNIRNIDYLTEYTLNYYKTIKRKHNFGIVSGYTWQSWLNRSDGVSAAGFPNDNFTYYNLSSALTVDKPVNRTTEWSLASFLGRFNYSYDRRYMVTLTARADGATRLAPGHKWDLFPSLALGWNAHNEKFLKNNKTISELKIRTSYGISGNQSIGVGSTLSRYDSGTGVMNQSLVTTYYPANMPNKNLGWENTNQFNTGIDLGLWAGRVTFNADFYYKRTSNLLINLPVPLSTGFTTYTTNSGEVENKGMDFDLGGNILTGKLKWKATGNISFNRNKVLKFDGIMESFMGSGISSVNNQPLNIAKVGYPIGSFFGYRIDGIYQTQEEIDNGPVDPSNPRPGSFKFVDVNQDNKISDDDRDIIGNPYPDYIFGVNNDFSWKNFNLNIFIQGSIGQDVVNVSRYYADALTRNTSSNVRKEAWENRWTGPGTSNTYPVARATAVPFEGRFTNFIVEDASYVRLKSLTLSYNFKPQRIKFIENVSVFATAGNLLTLTKYKGYDPEINSRGTNSLTPGLDLGSIPQFRTYSLGFKVGIE